MAIKRKRVSAVDRREQILGVARQLFAKQGFRGTTTRQIADQAQVNEAILFRHFRSKEALYWAVLDELSQQRNSRGNLQALISERVRSDGTPDADEKFFAAVAEGLLERSRRDPNFIRLFLFSALERHSLSQRFFRTYTTVYWDLLAKYIRGRMRAGEFKTTNPLLAARSFIGMVGHYNIMHSLLGPGKYPDYSDRLVSKTLARIWLGGMRAKNGAA
jgi:TetR/AcrR family transcriptional regulator